MGSHKKDRENLPGGKIMSSYCTCSAETLFEACDIWHASIIMRVWYTAPLTTFWKKCLETSTIPPILKTAIITPHHKGDSHASASDYQSV